MYTPLNFGVNPNQSLTGNQFNVNPNQSILPMQQQTPYGGFLGQAGNAIGNWWDRNMNSQALFGGTNAQGMQTSGSFLPLAQGLGSLAQGYVGIKSLGLAQDQFAAQQDAYRTNLANQAQLTNNALYSQEQSRAAWEGRTPASKEEFIKLEGVKGA